MLGTFILEGGGKDVRDTLLLTKKSAQMYAERLTELTTALGFDGWLVNLLKLIPGLHFFVTSSNGSYGLLDVLTAYFFSSLKKEEKRKIGLFFIVDFYKLA